MSRIRRSVFLISIFCVYIVTFWMCLMYFKYINQNVNRRRTTLQIPHNFRSRTKRVQLTKFILNNPDLCQTPTKTKLSLVIIVLSARENFKERNLIRETWGSIRTFNNVTIAAVVFMLGSMGQTYEDEDTTGKIALEASKFGDIVTGQFVDTYQNLSRKAIMAYEWIAAYCSTSDIVLKTDDDVMLNIFQVTREVEVTPILESDSFWCFVHENEKPHRMMQVGEERYYVSYQEIPSMYFPPHCAGVGYLIRMNLALRIVTEIVEEEHMCKHEDVYITGVLTARLNASMSEDTDIIRLQDKVDQWYLYHSNGGLSHKTLSQLGKQISFTGMDVMNIFHKVYGTILFYLIIHGEDYEKEFRQVWDRVLVDNLIKQRVS